MTKTKGQLASDDMREYVMRLFTRPVVGSAAMPVSHIQGDAPSQQQTIAYGKALLSLMPSLGEIMFPSQEWGHALDDFSNMPGLIKRFTQVGMSFQSEHNLPAMEGAQCVKHLLKACGLTSSYLVCSEIARASVCAMRAGAPAEQIKSIAALMFHD